ncbi:Protein of unknown function DUF2344 [Thalassoporum mexicanum PCC 7367]|uniref:TIGR03960 family B12-binding radical SAM protein n=1 Tax=Thalassoporum mexicanum TaxID=3457544 RepID=UPI00029F9D44|nr:TIGR03960 family B12-binding radical SAM protein [Pseudanabaena sp. PCC 7367]AFY71060.1 Protein of unknown function DUF2344 [Pseudanabaena sp. PCC 7367]
MTLTQQIENLITAEIEKPARYLGNELGAVHKPWQSATIRWSLTYPEVYEVAASNLGHIILYSILNQQAGQLCDRAYLPAADLTRKLRETNTPLFAVESKRSLVEFDILGFSLSYELGATNILEMLDLAQIPLTWRERQAASPNDLSLPLIFAGGQTATSNPEPYAEFFDFLAMGDGEECLPEIGAVLKTAKETGKSRQEMLLDLAQQVPGVYVPQFYDSDPLTGAVKPNRPDVPARILRRVATPMPERSIGLVPYIETVHDRLTIEIRRGCTRGCRFCQPGMLTRPARDVEPEAIVNTVEKAMRETGYNEFSLLSLSCSDYLALPAVGLEIKERFPDEHVTLSLPSQRVDRFDHNIANVLKGDGRNQGLTFAPEAGTQRLRDVINKDLTDAELLRGIKIAHDEGWDKIKLYFMIGLPTETDEDVLGIARTIAWLQEQCRTKGRKRLNFNVTISNFTPKPHTPFQWHGVSTTEFERKQDLLRAEFRKIRGVKVNYTDVRISAMEDFVGRGDRTLSQVIKHAWQKGAGMDSWFENTQQAFAAWSRAIAEAGLQWKMPLPALEADLPWDHLDTGIDKQWLIDDWYQSLEAKVVPDCSFAKCYQCGVCGPSFGHNVVLKSPPIPEFLQQTNLEPIASVQRLRMVFGKLGQMALISHLDLMRLFERAARRAQLPLSFTGGFHPGPRIAIANALPLGYCSNGEVADFELLETIDPAEFKQRLAAKLPEDVPILDVVEIDLKAKSAARTITRAEYTIELGFDCGAIAEQIANEPIEKRDRNYWQAVLDRIIAAPSIQMVKITKSGKEKMIELRDRLHEIELIDVNPFMGSPKLRFVGSCLPNGDNLKPDYVLFMLQEFSNSQDLKINRVTRESLS